MGGSAHGPWGSPAPFRDFFESSRSILAACCPIAFLYTLVTVLVQRDNGHLALLVDVIIDENGTCLTIPRSC